MKKIADVIAKLMHIEYSIEDIWGFNADNKHADEFSDMLDDVGECIDFLDSHLEQYQEVE